MANLFLQDIRQFIPSDRIYTDELRTLGWGTDASFYRQIPKVVIRSDGEEEISKIVKSHPEFLKKIEVLRDKVRTDEPLAARIRTTGIPYMSIVYLVNTCTTVKK